MSNQLSTTKDSFEFLPFTDVTMEDLPDWMDMLYEESFNSDLYENTPIMAEYIPTRFMVINQGMTYFDQHKYHYALNGHAPHYLEEIEGYLEEGYDENEIIDMWTEWRSYNASYSGAIPENCLESMLIRDINRGLNLYHMSFLLDGHDLSDNPYFASDHVIIKEWINPPIVQVW